ncbi:hypothetical protein BGZ65_012161, partial [Modicella reniformis]
MIIGVLAILKAGGAYVPLDPTYPKERLIDILEDARPEIGLVDNVGLAILKGAKLNRLCQKDHADETSIVLIDVNEPRLLPHTNPEVAGLTSRHLAYVIYTSGSTGKPKGVMIEHQGVVNHTISRLVDFGINKFGRVLQFSSLNFDLSVIETFAALFSGANLHLLPNNIRIDQQKLWDYLECHSITLAVLPPAVLRDCKGFPPLNTRMTLVSTGEELPASQLRMLRELIPHGTVINDYGATEVTVNAMGWSSSEDFTGDTVPVGRPHHNKRIYILDKQGRPVPFGAVGELYLGGTGVARGYLNQPELTAKVFLQDPFAAEPDARMYKTGDLAR